MGKNGIARNIAGGVGTQVIKSGSNFTQGVSTGRGAGVTGRIGQSVNSLGQGMVGNRTSSINVVSANLITSFVFIKA